MLQLGIIHPSSSSWSSQLHYLLPKHTPGDWCPCGDFRQLNKITVLDRYPVSHLLDFTATIRGATIFTHNTWVVRFGQVSIVPPTCLNRMTKRGEFHLQAINGSDILTFGLRLLTLDLGLRHMFRWVFIIADMSHPVPAADFLYHFGLLVDL